MKALTIIGLVISIVALVISIWAFVIVSNDVRSDVAAERALVRREKQLISQLWPKLKKIHAAMGMDAPKEQPQSIEELFGPLLTPMEPIEKDK